MQYQPRRQLWFGTNPGKRPTALHVNGSGIKEANLAGETAVPEFVFIMPQTVQSRPHRCLQATERSVKHSCPTVGPQ